MSPTPARAGPLARRLLDAQVAFHLRQLDDDRLAATVAGLVDDLLEVGSSRQLEDLVDRAAVTTVVVRLVSTMPGSAAASGLVELATTLLCEGPPEPHRWGELVPRDRVEALLDAVLALHPELERFLGALADVPPVGTVASRFMGRIVGEVVAANRAVADRVPGLGSLMSLGSGAASRVMGAADRQFEGLIGDTMGRGGAFAVRRLNRIVIETLRDPTTRDAALQAWDLIADAEATGVSEAATRQRVSAVADALHELAIDTLATERAAQLAGVVVDAVFDRFGGFTPAELLAELDLTRDALVADLTLVAPAAVGALRESGELERLIRARLEPFYASPEAAALLR